VAGFASLAGFQSGLLRVAGRNRCRRCRVFPGALVFPRVVVVRREHGVDLLAV
jgi:hypothetical protein